MKRFLTYLARWQLSTPILAVCIALLPFGVLGKTIAANLIGGMIFFWVDRYIFADKFPVWQIAEKVECYDCGSYGRGYRLVKDKRYNKINATPEFRCEKCSIKKRSETIGSNNKERRW